MRYKITIKKDGTSVVEVLEGEGDSCLIRTQALEQRLGKPEGERVLKPEFHQSEFVEEVVREYDR